MAAKALESDKTQGVEKPMDEAKKAVLNKALDDITKRYGEGAIIRLGEARHLEVADPYRFALAGYRAGCGRHAARACG